jgi:hypothetical protein
MQPLRIALKLASVGMAPLKSTPALRLAAAVENNKIKHRCDQMSVWSRIDAGKTPKKVGS